MPHLTPSTTKRFLCFAQILLAEITKLTAYLLWARLRGREGNGKDREDRKWEMKGKVRKIE